MQKNINFLQSIQFITCILIQKKAEIIIKSQINVMRLVEKPDKLQTGRYKSALRNYSGMTQETYAKPNYQYLL